jgi:hypothetical protein
LPRLPPQVYNLAYEQYVSQKAAESELHRMSLPDNEFKAGDSIRVKEGVNDPDSDADISGWQGRILEIAEDESGQPLVLVAWDSHTLKSIPQSYLEQSEIEGLDWQQFYLRVDDIQHAQSRDTQRDVDDVVDELAYRVFWVSLGEEGKRIQRVLSGAKNEREAFAAWKEYLQENLRFPFKAEVSEYQDRGRLSQGDRITVREISVVDDLYGIIVSGKWGLQSIDFPLCDLAVIGEGVNRQIVSDYAVWFANR